MSNLMYGHSLKYKVVQEAELNTYAPLLHGADI